MKIRDVGSFYITQKDFFYTKNGMLFSIQNKKEKTIAPIVNSCWGSKYEENSIVVFGDFGSKVYNYKGELEYDTNLYVEYYENQNNYIIYDENSNQTKINNEILFCEGSLLDLMKYDDYFFYMDSSSPDMIKMTLDNCLSWQFPLLLIPNNPHNDNYNKEADWEVKKLIGVLEGKLWIALNHHTIIALDIATGALIHQIHTIANFHCSWLPSGIPLSEATQIDKKTHRLIGFMWEFYWEIDPTNGAIQFYDLTNELSAQKIRSDIANFVLTDSKIYFASHFDSKIGALDKVTKKLTWEYDFQKEEGAEPRIMELQGNENLLGALSSQGTLYIFEREDNT